VLVVLSLLIRHTGMRIGECADLPCDCLRSTGPHQWAIHVPLGKLKTERMVPVDSFVCELVQRLRFFRSLDSVPADGLLLPRLRTKEALVRQLRDYLQEVCFSVSLPVAIVPHQLRHTHATEMLRSGVSFPGVMKLLGHNSSDMTMKYLDIALPDLQREFYSARSHPRHLAPKPKSAAVSVRSGLNGVIDSFLATQHALAMFRRTTPNNVLRRSLDRLSNRLTKIVTKSVTSTRPQNEHGLAGYARNTTTIRKRCRCGFTSLDVKTVPQIFVRIRLRRICQGSVDATDSLLIGESLQWRYPGGATRRH
jgi:hypothetical protein